MALSRVAPRRTSNPGTIPTPDQIDVGELVINVYDAKLYTKRSNNQIVDLTGAASGTIDVDDVVAGTLAVEYGGTGISSYSGNTYLRSSNSSHLEEVTAEEILNSMGGGLGTIANNTPTDADILEYNTTNSKWTATKAPRSLMVDGGNF